MKRLSAMVMVLVFSVTGTAYADWAKIGVVDLQKIMQASPEMKATQQKLEKEFKPRRDKLMAMEESLKKDMEKFKRDSAVMSESQKQALQKKIMTAQQEFEREGQKYQQELSAEHNKAMQDLYGKVKDAIAKLAENKKYDLILQKDAAPYSASKLDVTDEVQKNIK